MTPSDLLDEVFDFVAGFAVVGLLLWAIASLPVGTALSSASPMEPAPQSPPSGLQSHIAGEPQ